MRQGWLVQGGKLMKGISTKTWVFAAAALLVIAAGVVVWRGAVQPDEPQYVVWEGSDGEDIEIFLYEIDTGEITQISNNEIDDKHSEISGDHIAWMGNEDGDWDIYLYQISSGITTQITNNDAEDYDPQVSGDYVVWQGWKSKNPEIYLYRISTGITTQVSNNEVKDSGPQISGDYVVWGSHAGGDVIFWNININRNCSGI